MSQLSDIGDTARSEYNAWITTDWTDVGDSNLFHAFKSYHITLYQVLSCRDISNSSYRLSGNDEDDEDEDDNEDSAAIVNKRSNTTRMLKLLLYNGVEHKIAYEYEPIACLDVFNANRLTGNPVRCCGKIALFNSPIERRGALWLTPENVKLVFEGYECRYHSEDHSRSSAITSSQQVFTEEHPVDIGHEINIATNPLESTEYTQEIHWTVSNHDGCITHPAEGDDISQWPSSSNVLSSDMEANCFNAYILDEGNMKALERYFPVGSSYLEFSYISYLVRENVELSEDSFQRFANSVLQSNGYDDHSSIAKVISTINGSPCFSPPGPSWFLEDLHYGFLDHAIPLSYAGHNGISELILTEFNKLSPCDWGNLWLVKLDDCSASFFCIVSTESLGITEVAPLVVSSQINSINGFFEVKTMKIDGEIVYIISQYTRYLGDEEFLLSAETIDSQFQRIESLVDF
ncbi:hypothetical protein X943_000638 [Babesia divergens]|uniref:RecQ mediated genome instability protein 1 OB-fold domain-containing protein n=1 Tax=Babesia divergens TaxID=32595 RepID=A0AAD9GJN5_BABDI|nr:hypothetical protein X943_000638 [Babesia divergens]